MVSLWLSYDYGGVTTIIKDCLKKKNFQIQTLHKFFPLQSLARSQWEKLGNVMLAGHLCVSHTFNPSYLGGRDQEDHSLKPTWANSSQNSISISS
jgi:hypothetical protein